MRTLLVIHVSLCLLFPAFLFAYNDQGASRRGSEDYHDSRDYTEEDFMAGDMMYRWHVETSGRRILKCREIFFDVEWGISFGPWEVAVNHHCIDYHHAYFEYCDHCNLYYCSHPYHGTSHHHHHFHTYHVSYTHHIYYTPHLCIHARHWRHCTFCLHWRPWMVWKPWYHGRYFHRKRFVHHEHGTYYAYHPRFKNGRPHTQAKVVTHPKYHKKVVKRPAVRPHTVKKVPRNTPVVRNKKMISKTNPRTVRKVPRDANYTQKGTVISKVKPRKVPIEKYTYTKKKNMSTTKHRPEKKWSNVNIVKHTNRNTRTKVNSPRVRSTQNNRKNLRKWK